MTGFGRAEKNTNNQQIVVEIKSVNSKGFDLRMKISPRYASQEMMLRKLINDSLLRGKIDLLVSVDTTDENEHSINQQAFSNYYKCITTLADSVKINEGDLLNTILRLPGVVEQNNDKIDAEQWRTVLETIQEAISALCLYRAEEGAATALDIQKRLKQISILLEAVDPAENERIDKIKARLMSSLEQIELKGKVDENRLEQEMIYYLDKFDLNEEKMRLKQHCEYFVEEMQQDVMSKGKKLNFILQEMGREINTLGSKANSADIQRLVIQMKNEADKIKEQLANIL